MSDNRLILKSIRSVGLLILLWAICFHFVAIGSVTAQATEDIQWSTIVNISNTPDKTSVDPVVLADPAGYVHLFWGEKVTDTPGEQADTIMYTRWDGREWTKPVDIYFAPPVEVNLLTGYPHAAIDSTGRIHLIWLGEPNAPNRALYYGSVEASQALSARAWEPRATLAEDLTGTEYSIHIATSPPETVHILYARVPGGDSIREERAVTYIRSTDGGRNWSEPVDIYTVPFLNRGASHTRLLVDPAGKLYASWTEWDESGNGQAVYFARSLDNGLTWDKPVKLAQRLDPEYERDWNNLALLGPDQLVAMWEGGYRAYRYAMYSNDGGVTWSDPVDIFPYLIGENGFVEFGRDSLDRLHLFYAQRIREGNENRGERIGIWHSIWLGGMRWSEPEFITKDLRAVRTIVNPKIAIMNGNRVVVVWNNYGVNEILVQTGIIGSAPALTPTPWKPVALPQAAVQTTATPTPVDTNLSTSPLTQIDQEQTLPNNNGMIIFFGIMPAVVIVLSFLSIQYYRIRSK